jgi:hypothetical protein
MPVDLFPSLSLYTMPGETNFFWIDDSSGGGFALDDPAFPGPGGGATNDYTPDTSFNQASFIFSYTSNVWQYTNYWLQINSDATSNTQVTVVDTIPGLFYQVQTNSNLLSTNWIPWTNLLASTQNTPAPLLNLGTNQVFFRGKIVLPGGSLLTNGLVDKSLSSGAGGWFFAVSYLDQLAWWVDNEGGTFYDSGPGVLVPNQWEFVTVTWSYASNRASFYINGLFNSSVTLGTAERSSAGQPLSVGTLQEESGGGANNFQGSIRCVGIYDRVLSAAEVESNFLSTAYSTNVAVPDLLYYKLNTGSSNEAGPQTVYDSSTIGTNNGIIESVTYPTNDGIFGTTASPEFPAI